MLGTRRTSVMSMFSSGDLPRGLPRTGNCYGHFTGSDKHRADGGNVHRHFKVSRVDGMPKHRRPVEER